MANRANPYVLWKLTLFGWWYHSHKKSRKNSILNRDWRRQCDWELL